MTIWSRLFGRPAPVTTYVIPTSEPLAPLPMRWSNVLEAVRGKARPESPFGGLPIPPPGVRPVDDPPPKGMAMDDASGGFAGAGTAWGGWATGSAWGEGLYFPGYPYLAELAQRPEYRNITETVAEEMTRKWIKLVSSGDEDKTDQIKVLDDAMKRHGMRETFNRAMEIDGFMGMGVIYIDTGSTSDPDELKMPLILSEAKIGKGQFRGFVPVEPTWISPKYYNSTDPLRADYFKPTAWYVMGKEVHESRLLIIRSREVPDLLKAAYNFGGLSLSQMSKPYVDNWLRTRQSVSDLLHAFTTWNLKTNIAALTQNATAMLERMAAFVLGRDNRGLLITDKETEELENISAPLGSLDKLQAQAQEQMAFPSQQPLMKLIGYQPTGLNADTTDIIRSWYDRIRAKQEKTFGPAVTIGLKVLMLSELGAIDPEITFEFQALWELDEAGKAAVEKTKADTDAVYMQESVITNEEVRTRLAGDPNSPYHGLEGAAPEVPDPMEQFEADKSDVAEKIDRGGAEGSESGANSGV
jgi:uncharacterized protein